MITVGIDPGARGGVCAYRQTYAKRMVQLGDLPSQEKELLDYLHGLREKGQVLVFIERVQAWVDDAENRGKNIRMAKLLGHYNRILTTLRLGEFPFIEVPPQRWQTYLKRVAGVDKKKYKNPKNAYKAFAIERFPEKIKQINLKTADAACIAWYGFQVLQRFPEETIGEISNTEAFF